MCIKEVEPLGWHRLQPAQVTRSVRLLSILKTCFGNHPRASLVIQNYEESKSFHRCCGFECLRLIAREFSVKTRTELLFFRTQLANSTITAPTIKEFCFESGFHYQSGSHHSSHPGLWAWTAYVDSGLKFTGHVWPLV